MDSEDPDIKEQEAYVKELVADCPTYPPDDRQSGFYGAMDSMRQEPEMAEMDDVHIVSMKGFPAAVVNLGWLLDKANKACDKHFKDKGSHYVAKVIEMMLEDTVQRLKQLEVSPEEDIEAFRVSFQTKDDHGYYRYEFSIPYPEDA